MPVGSGLATQFGVAEETFTNEVQRISGTPSGAFTLSFEGATTASIVVGASAAQVVAALEALPNIGTGGVSATGGTLPTAIDVTFIGPLVAGRDVGTLAVANGATGLTITTQTAGKGYGDTNTPSRFYEIESEGLALEIDQVENFGLRAGNAYQRADRRRQGLRRAAGPVELAVHTKGFGLILKHIFGKAAVITTPGGGSTSRDQTFTLGDGWQIGLMAQVGRPDAQSDAGNVNPYNYRGCKVVEAEFKLSVGELLMCSLAFDGRDEEETTALATASYPSATKILDWSGSTVKIGGAPVDVQDVTLKIARKIKDDRYFHGSNLKRQPILNDAFDVTLEVETEFIDPTLYRRFSQEPTSLPSATWQIDGDVIEAITGGNANFGLLFTIPNVVTTGDTPGSDGPDVLGQKLVMRAVHDGTNELITCRYRSTDVAS